MKFYIELPKDLEIKTAIVRRLEKFSEIRKDNPYNNEIIKRMTQIGYEDKNGLYWIDVDHYTHNGYPKVTIDEALKLLEKKEDEYKAGDWVKLSGSGGQYSANSDRKLPDGYAHLLVENKSCPLNTPLLVIGEQFLAETRCLILTDTVHAYHVTYNATISLCGVKYKDFFSSVTDKEVEAHLIMTIKEEIVKDEKIMWGVHEVMFNPELKYTVTSGRTTDFEDWEVIKKFAKTYNIDEIHCHDCSDRKIVVKRDVLDRIVEKCNA